MKRVARKVHYEGRVQGVGFRWTVKHIASGFEVTGEIRNLPDGRVELQAAGEPEELDAFLLAIRDSGLGGHIANVHQRELPEVPPWKGFRITG